MCDPKISNSHLRISNDFLPLPPKQRPSGPTDNTCKACGWSSIFCVMIKWSCFHPGGDSICYWLIGDDLWRKWSWFDYWDESPMLWCVCNNFFCYSSPWVRGLCASLVVGGVSTNGRCILEPYNLTKLAARWLFSYFTHLIIILHLEFRIWASRQNE